MKAKANKFGLTTFDILKQPLLSKTAFLNSTNFLIQFEIS